MLAQVRSMWVPRAASYYAAAAIGAMTPWLMRSLVSPPNVAMIMAGPAVACCSSQALLLLIRSWEEFLGDFSEEVRGALTWRLCEHDEQRRSCKIAGPSLSGW